jgi:hypothetical protein
VSSRALQWNPVSDRVLRMNFSITGQVPPDPDQLKDDTVASAT